MVGKELPDWIRNPDAQIRDILGWAYGYVYENLYSYVKKRCPVQVEAEDILMDTALRLAGVAQRISIEFELLFYAQRIAQNVLLNEIRNSRRHTNSRRHVWAPSRGKIYHDSCAQYLETKDFIAKISRHLTKSQSELCHLLYVEGKSDSLCAEEFGLSRESFRARKARLHRTLRKWIPANFA